METLTATILSPTLATFFISFLSVYLLAYLAVFRNWGATNRATASSCLISLFHGTPAVVMAAAAIASTPSSHRTFASQNTHFQNTVLEYSVAYFAMDLLHLMVFFPADFLFILHHLATLYVFLTCRYVVGGGGFALLPLLVLAEATSACQNAWCLLGLRRDASPAAATAYQTLSFPFYVFYSVVRCILGPLCVYKIFSFYYMMMSGQELEKEDDHVQVQVQVPKWAWVSWMFVIVTAILVSIVWISAHWSVWYRGRRIHKTTKKVA